MGKTRRQRTKLHAPAGSENRKLEKDSPILSLDTSSSLPLKPQANIFAGIDINFDNLKTRLSDDAVSLKSYKSVKSELGANKILPKKDKLKLRRELFLKKIDTAKQMRKSLKKRNKKKSTGVLSETKSLFDALPSLDYLLKSKGNANNKMPTVVTKKKKCVEKSKKRQKNIVQDISIFKRTLKNKTFKSNPLTAISDHIKAVVESERSLISKQ